MAATFKATVTTSHTVTPAEVARLFCELDNFEQAEFFNAVAVEVDSWGQQFCFQLQSVIDSGKLDAGGITIMRDIGEYGEECYKNIHSMCAPIEPLTDLRAECADGVAA